MKTQTHYLAFFFISFCLSSVMLLRATPANADSDSGQTVPPAAALTVDVSGGGQVSVNPSGDSFAYGQVVTLSAAPNPGWNLVRWDSESTPFLPWLDTKRNYRTEVTVSANGVARTNQPAEVQINFTPMLAELGVNGEFDPASIRVAEIDATGNVVDADAPFQFDPNGGFNPSLNASGVLILYLPGQTSAQQDRHFHVYFGLTGKTYPAPTFPAPVKLTTSGIDDEGQAALKIETLNGTYFYQTDAGGFSSLVDTDDNDWINYSTAAGADGAYRGIPNAVRPADGGHLHPGKTTAETTVIHQGPLKITLRSIVYAPNSQPLWDAIWYIYPRHATMVLNGKPDGINYWFLYEGTPGGAIGNEDTVTRSDGVTTAIETPWEGDLTGEEWVYFADGDAARSLFLYKHGGDSVVDSYQPYADYLQAVPEIKMTVFGFGRELGTLDPQYSSAPTRFTLGLNDETEYNAVKTAIQGIYSGLVYMIAGAEQRLPLVETLPPTTPLALSMTHNRTLTAVFGEQQYGLIVSDAGAGVGAVTVEPQKNYYRFGDSVTLTAEPEPGSNFAGWAGAADGDESTTTITIYGNTSVTANFEQDIYGLTVDLAGEGIGSVERQPAQSGYLYGDSVTLTARPAKGSFFDGWSGDTGGQAISTTVTLFGNAVVTTTFGLYPYDLELDIIGNGLVSTDPEQSTYTYGQYVTLTATSGVGYAFLHWEGDLTGSNPTATLIVNGDMTVTARFTPVHTVVAAPGEGQQGYVAVGPDKEEYVDGETIELHAYPALDWAFVRWSGDLSGSSNPVTTTVTSDMVVVAEFARLHDLSVETQGQGKVDISPELLDQQYPTGMTVSATAIPAAGWRFAKWGGDWGGSRNPLDVQIEQDVDAIAIFELDIQRVFLPIANR